MATKEATIWEELRKPFPKGSVGLLPKPTTKDGRKGTCGDCGKYHQLPAMHVDYVGHAAVTDRLNNVAGPENWNWEPVAFDDRGLPAIDSKGGLWIKLTINGVTRFGYGDGSSDIKQLIGDALRNAAMRFGVALDLWSKEELESSIEHPELKNDKPTQRPAVGSAPATPALDVMSEKQLKLMQTLFGKLGLTERADKLVYISEVIGRDIESAKDLKKAEATKVIDRLKSLTEGEPEPEDDL